MVGASGGVGGRVSGRRGKARGAERGAWLGWRGERKAGEGERCRGRGVVEAGGGVGGR